MPECYVCGEEIPEEETDYTYAGTTTLKPIHKSCRPYVGKSSEPQSSSSSYSVSTEKEELKELPRVLCKVAKKIKEGLEKEQEESVYDSIEIFGDNFRRFIEQTNVYISPLLAQLPLDTMHWLEPESPLFKGSPPSTDKLIKEWNTVLKLYCSSSSPESSSSSRRHLSSRNRPKRESVGNPGATETDFAAKGFGEQFAEAIYQAMYRTAQNEAIDWEENVADFIEKCEKRGGVVQFRTKYNDKRWTDPENPGRYMVLAVCYGREIPEVPGQWFNNVPEEDIKQLEAD